ncbi:2 TM domain-containing transmembrane protein, partial [Acrasis kona]
MDNNLSTFQRMYDTPESVNISKVAPGSNITKVVNTEVNTSRSNASMLVSTLSATLVFAGSTMILAGAGMLISDWIYYYHTMGICMIIGFSLWTVASLVSFIGTIGRDNKIRNYYTWVNLFTSVI